MGAMRYVALATLGLSSVAFAGAFNGVGENGTDAYGYYYAVGGGLFPNGQTRNGDNASGGTIRFVWDDPAWGRAPAEQGQWQKDDWYPVTSSLALTLYDAGGVAFDNNGIETGNVPAGFYTYPPSMGVVTGYSMSNNFDWIYAGYFQTATDITITKLTGYFVVGAGGPSYGFNPNNPVFNFNMNIFSEVAGMLPKNTGSFSGDVFSSDAVAGTFSWSDTGIDRVSSAVSDIYRLEYTLNAPMVLKAGSYYFSHDAEIVPLPTAAMAAFPILGLLALGRRCRTVK